MTLISQTECQKKCLDISKAKKYGWKPRSDFDRAFKITYNHFISHSLNK